MKKCPFFGVCGSCKYDFTADDYRKNKMKLLDGMQSTQEPFWTSIKSRRRADFSFSDGKFGFFKKSSKDIVNLKNCPLLTDEINEILPKVANLPWCGSGSCLITSCKNGIDIAITSVTPYFSKDFKNAVESLNAIRISWNGKVIKQIVKPIIDFNGKEVEYPIGAFLQPTVESENFIRDMVLKAASGYKKIADLFCGIGNFTFALNAVGFDISGTGIKRDLFKNPLTVDMLKQYDCVVMDPPRAGALAQCKELVKSEVSCVIYVSCNPETFKRDSNILNKGGYKLKDLCPVDQFVGSIHWELFAVFQK